jgi:3-phytase
MQFKTNGTERNGAWLLIQAALLVLALISGSALAQIGSGASDDKKAEAKADKEKTKKTKVEIDDDEDDDAQEDQRKLEKERAKAEKKAREEAEKKARSEKSRSEKLAKSGSEIAAESHVVSRSLSKAESKKVDTDANRGAAPVAIGSDLELVHATVETEPVPHSGDAADDPAIWIHPTDPSLSTIIGTNKQGGLAVYDLSGKQIQYVAEGLPDNVDLRDGFPLGGQKVTLVTAGSRKDNTIQIYKVNPQTRQLENVAARPIKHTIAVYGMCMYRSKADKFYYFGTSKSGDVEQFELSDNGSGKVDAKSVRKFKVGTTVEGCVADDELGHFYVAEEAAGIWKYGAEPNAGSNRTQVGKVGDGHLFADVEGLAIAYGPNGTGYLLASSQGNYSYVVYKREGNNEFVKKFRIGDGVIDGAEETDGIDVTATPLGDKFPKGLFVVQDGFNDKGSKNQNFKLVPLDAIIK